jgi:hypothetical protein
LVVTDRTPAATANLDGAARAGVLAEPAVKGSRGSSRSGASAHSTSVPSSGATHNANQSVSAALDGAESLPADCSMSSERISLAGSSAVLAQVIYGANGAFAAPGPGRAGCSCTARRYRSPPGLSAGKRARFGLVCSGADTRNLPGAFRLWASQPAYSIPCPRTRSTSRPSRPDVRVCGPNARRRARAGEGTPVTMRGHWGGTAARQ